jgi:hypothetical protein
MCIAVDIIGTLRGHTEEKSNFIALINYRAETDQILATHLQNSPPNARSLSPTIQNELIDICVHQLLSLPLQTQEMTP